MKFIKPSEISSKIMTLIEESDEYVIIVSPYVKISKWYKLLKKLDALKGRNIPVEFIIRDDKSNQTSFEELNDLGINYRAIKDLHCKLYLNEKSAIVSSMNLLLSSEINSLELAYRTESDYELKELQEFCERHLNISFSNENIESSEFHDDLKEHVCKLIREEIGGNIRAKQDDGSLIFNTKRNKYTSFIWSSKQNLLRISGILSKSEFDFLNQNGVKTLGLNGFNIELHDGGKKYYNSIWGTMDLPLNSSNLNYVYENEKSIVAEKIAGFIIEVDKLKQ